MVDDHPLAVDPDRRCHLDTGVADCNLHSDGFSAFYFWGDNGANFGIPQVTIDCHGAVHQNGYAGSLSQHIQSSRYFGWQAQCNQSSCTPTGAGIIVFSVTAIRSRRRRPRARARRGAGRTTSGTSQAG